MSEISTSCDEIVNAGEGRSQGLKYLPHWPPVTIDFEDVIYTVEDGIESELKIKIFLVVVEYLFLCYVDVSKSRWWSSSY